MPADLFLYTRLPGRSLRRMAWQGGEGTSLWMGKDHLLVVNRERFSESCKRFYWTDIQAVTMTRQGAQSPMWIDLIVALFSLLLLSVSLWFLLLVVPCALLRLVHLLRGETCRCYLHTAVHRERLYSLGRVSSATEALFLLRERIEAAQGELTGEALEELAEGQDTIAAASLSEIRRIKPIEPVRHENGKIHLTSFLVLTFAGLFLAGDMLYEGSIAWKNNVDSFFLLVSIILIVMSLVRQRGSDLPDQVKRTTQWSLGVYVVAFFLQAFGAVLENYYQRRPFESLLTDIETLSGDFIKIAAFISGLLIAACGMNGLRRLFQHFKAATSDAETADLHDGEEGA